VCDLSAAADQAPAAPVLTALRTVFGAVLYATRIPEIRRPLAGDRPAGRSLQERSHVQAQHAHP
ncbi:MAG: hypothetical protein ACK53L_00350, partial [Pirellulaceae bacterium]